MKNRYIPFIILFIYSVESLAQTDAKDFSRTWDINFSIGTLIGGPSGTNVGLPASRVASFQKDIPWSIGLGIPLNNGIASTLCISRTGFEGIFVNRYNSFVIVGISPQLTYIFEDLLFIGGGPALYLVNHNKSYSDKDAMEQKFGLEFQWAVKYPQKTLFFAQLNLHLGLAFSPVKYPLVNSQATQSQQYIYYLSVPMNKFYAGLGFGIRL